MRLVVVALLAPLLATFAAAATAPDADAQGTIHIGVSICRDDTLQECDPRVESHWGGSRRLSDTDVARVRLSIVNPTDLTIVEAEIDNTYSDNCTASWFDVPSLRVLEPSTTTYLICDVPPSSRDWELTAYLTAQHDRYGELADHDTAYGYVEVDASVGTERDVACLPGTVIDCTDVDGVYLSPDNETATPTPPASPDADLGVSGGSTAAVITNDATPSPGPGVARMSDTDPSSGSMLNSWVALVFAALVFGGMGTLLGQSMRRQQAVGVPVQVRQRD